MSKADTVVNGLRQDRDRYALLAFCWGDLLLTLDRDLRIETMSGASEALTGRTVASWTNRPLDNLIDRADRGRIAGMLEALTPTRRAMAGTVRLDGPRGMGTRVSVAAHRLESGSDRIYVAMRRLPEDAPETAPPPDAVEEARHLAGRLAAAGSSGAEMTLLAIPPMGGATDPDSKRLGDTLDNLLKAHSLGGDTATRLHSGHYSVLHEAGQNFSALVGRIEAMIHAADPAAPRVEAVTLPMREASMSEDDLARGLVYAMHRFGEGQGMTLQEAGERLRTTLSDAMGAVTRLRRAIDNGAFDLVFQPIVNIADGSVHHYEVLTRFEHAGTTSPFETILLAEETGLIADFDLAMARKAVGWLAARPLNESQVNIAINISGRSIVDPAYSSGLHRLLDENGWLGRRLSFEITESAQIADLDSANGFIQGLRNRGFAVMLDDFGAGASSFRYLSVLEVDAVKFDGDAIRHAQRAQKGRAFLSALTELCRRMGISTIAEMIETPEARDFVRECGCHYAQGYLYGAPAPDISRFARLPKAGLPVALRLG
ncbi:EAL domain-containing protein [Acidiphilium sp. C61]|uniref:EAL domain-containing protein n=1 Tax=Acidiphilium sp. C61 TaxID=1671485 RepID=UPI00157A9E37|nr:EAL domain-containing protein [Acidiphilium sp. C61]